MFEERRATAREKQFRVLQEKCEEMADEIKRLNTEKASLEAKLEDAKASAAKHEEAYQMFTQSAAEAREVRDKYLKAYDDLQVIRRKYSAEVGKLIAEMERDRK